MLLFCTKCPAKVNLSLSVLGKDEAAGMHTLDSVLAKIDLYDEITVRILPRPGLSVKFEASGEVRSRTPVDTNDNTLVRAYGLLNEVLGGTLPGLSVEVKKVIPVGSGLGGASSDAAGLLKLIHHLGTKTAALPSATATAIAAIGASGFAEVASSVGADVPSFLSEGAVRIRGFGEVVERVELQQLSGYRLLLVAPSEPLSTKEMYSRLDEVGGYGDNHTETFLERWLDAGAEEALPLARNDFEEVARKELPLIAEVIDALRAQHFPLVSLTGTGSCVFALIRKDEEAPKVHVPPETRSITYGFILRTGE